MRLPLISPSDLTSEQRPIYEDMRAGAAYEIYAHVMLAEHDHARYFRQSPP